MDLHFQGVDTLNDLRASLHYYESLADANGDIERQTVIDETALKLKNIISTLEKELEGKPLSFADSREG